MKNSLKSILNCSEGILSRKCARPVLFAVLLLTTLFTGTGHSDTVIDAVVAIVGNEIVTQSDLDRLSQSNRASGRNEDRSALIHRLIEERLIMQEVRKKRVSVSDAEIEFALNDIQSRNRLPDRDALKKAVASENQSWRKYVRDLENQLLVLKLLSREVNINLKVDEAAVRDYYETHSVQFRLPDRVQLTRLLLRGGLEASEEKKKAVEEKLEAIGSALKQGTAFEALVKKYSEGPRKGKAGNLGFFNRGELAPKIEQLVSGLQTGAVSPPHYTSQNVQIFQLKAREAGRKKHFEIVKKEIEARLLSEQRAKLQAQWIAGLFEQTYVDIK